ncbi:hypothetical protein A4G29_15690 [Mycobacterium kansasii]|nr:hypothetical protein A4G29_15690 [Mycobacterium kansasii]
MWIQAATTMSVYHAVSATALTSIPRTSPAPVIVKPGTAIAADIVQAAALDPIQKLLFELPLLIVSEWFNSILAIFEPFLLILWVRNSLSKRFGSF